MNTFTESENRVFNFMEKVQEEKLIQEQEENFQNSVDYKLKTLDKCQNDAKNICLDKIFCQIYKNAVPLGNDYKQTEDLDQAFRDFMADKCPDGLEFYVREGLKKNSPFAKKVLEAVENLVNDNYHDKAMNIEDTDIKDLVFNSDSDTQKRIDVIGQDLALPEISDAVKNNVKQTALSEITRAKKEKEIIKNLESELANDVNVTTSEAVQEALELKGFGLTKDYIPSLFEGIMINKLGKAQAMLESGENKYLYDALDEYGYTKESTDDVYASAEEIAFVESIKEYTGLSILKALKLESFTKNYVNDLAFKYAES